MNLHHLLAARADDKNPVRVGLIGAGKFGAMFLSQAPSIPGIDIAAIADLNADRLPDVLQSIGWDKACIARTRLYDDGCDLIAHEFLDVVIEATGDPRAGLTHAMAAIEAGRHIIMATVEADALAGAALAAKARTRGVVYSLAYGDQPALIAELVDWAFASGFAVTAAGKGTKYLPEYHYSTPETVWDHYGLTSDEAKAAGMNAKMFNSFLDGTKSAIEMAALANATGLAVPEQGLGFPPVGRDDLAQQLVPKADGGVLDHAGQVEVISSLHRDGTPVTGDLRWGVFVVFEAQNEYAARCLPQYGLTVDATGRRAALYKTHHLIGLELAVSTASVALRNEPTGSPRAHSAEVIAIAKRDLAPGEKLDGEGGSSIWGRLVPAHASGIDGLLPIGLADQAVMVKPVAKDKAVKRSDVALDPADPALALNAEARGMSA